MQSAKFFKNTLMSKRSATVRRGNAWVQLLVAIKQAIPDADTGAAQFQAGKFTIGQSSHLLTNQYRCKPLCMVMVTWRFVWGLSMMNN